MDTESGPARWQSCHIERILTRARWPGGGRRGIFVAVLDADAGSVRYLSRSEQFSVPSPTDADIATFHALLAVLVEDGWQRWRGPEIPIGLGDADRGYWNVVLRRPIVAPDAPDASASREAGEPAMEELRERAIARLREAPPRGRGARSGGDRAGGAWVRRRD